MSSRKSGRIMTIIGLLGDRDLSYLTHRELVAATSLLPEGVEMVWIPTDHSDCVSQAAEADGLWVIPGTPYRNDDAVYDAIATARTTGQPFLGTCGGFQYAVVEYARNVAGLPTAEHAEGAPGAEIRVVQSLSCSLIGQEREVTVVPGTNSAATSGPTPSPDSTTATTGWPTPTSCNSRTTDSRSLRGPQMPESKPLSCQTIHSSSRRSSSPRSGVSQGSHSAP